VARGLRRALACVLPSPRLWRTMLSDRLVEDLMLQGGVDQELVRWFPSMELAARFAMA